MQRNLRESSTQRELPGTRRENAYQTTPEKAVDTLRKTNLETHSIHQNAILRLERENILENTIKYALLYCVTVTVSVEFE